MDEQGNVVSLIFEVNSTILSVINGKINQISNEINSRINSKNIDHQISRHRDQNSNNLDQQMFNNTNAEENSNLHRRQHQAQHPLKVESDLLWKGKEERTGRDVRTWYTTTRSYA